MSSYQLILVGILTTHERTGWVSPAISEWQETLRLTNDTNKYRYMITHCKNFIPAAAARNFFCRQVKDYQPRPDWLLMLDNDIVPCANLFDCIKDAPADAAVVVPQMHMWDEGKPSVTLCWGMDESKAPIKDGTQKFTIYSDQWYELNKAGTGAIFIRPMVLDVISMPYFSYPLNQDQGIEGTEDIVFTKKVSEAGLKVYGNGSITVGHYHNVNLAVLAKYMYGEVASKAVEPSGDQERPSESPVPAAFPAC